MGKGMRSIYMLSLLETYAEDDNPTPGIIMVEEPELFLHPKLQKLSGDLLFRLARKNQVIFSTHSPNLLPNFNSRQIRQVVLDSDGYSTVREHTDISVILNDLGYSANDLMNVDFVFIVEGRQDKSRLPLLLRKYYSEIYDDEGKPSRVAIGGYVWAPVFLSWPIRNGRSWDLRIRWFMTQMVPFMWLWRLSGI